MAIAAANTVYAVRGQTLDAVEDPPRLQDWIDRHVGPLAVERARPLTAADLNAFRQLRGALRSLLNAAATGEPPDPAAVVAVNESAAQAPSYRALSVVEGRYAVTQESRAGPAELAIAMVAEDAIGLLGSSQRAEVHLCGAPRCVQFFLDDNHGRRWCSPACGNRARAARHYRRHSARADHG